MSKKRAYIYFILLAIAAWVAAYGPTIYRRQQTFQEVQAAMPHWVCVINADAVSSEYDVYTTRKYIVLDGQRYYSDEFRRWGHGGDYILMTMDDSQRIRWTRLSYGEAPEVAKEYGIDRAGCRRVSGTQTASNMPAAPPAPAARPLAMPAVFNWEKALGRAVQPVHPKHIP